jgi:ankyrin repeat protein
MKKLFLISAVLSVGFLNGMSVVGQNRPNVLLPEINEQIINKLIMVSATSNDLKTIVKTIEMTGLRYDNLVNFTKLVHALENKLNLATTVIAEEIQKLAIQESLKAAAQQYVGLANDLQKKVLFGGDGAHITELIKQGADVNASYQNGHNVSLLALAIEHRSDMNVLKVLLDAGANPNYNYSNTYGSSKLVDYAKKIGASEDVINLLNEAIKKQPQSQI